MPSGRVSNCFVIVAVLAFLYCADKPSQSSGAALGAEGLDYVPRNSNALFYANLQEFRKTPFGKGMSVRFQRELDLEEDPDYREFVERTGLDLNRDVLEVWGNAVIVDEERTEGGAIVRARFDRDRLLRYIEEKERGEFERQTYRDYELFVDPDDSDALTILDDQTVAFGHIAWLKKTIDHLKGDSPSIRENAVMMGLVEQIPDNSQVWAALDMRDLSEGWVQEMQRSGAQFQGAESLESLESMILYVQAGDAARTTLLGNFGSAEKAQLLADMLRGLKAMAKLAVSDDREIVDLLDRVGIEVDGPRLSIVATIDEELIRKLEENKDRWGNKGANWK